MATQSRTPAAKSAPAPAPKSAPEPTATPRPTSPADALSSAAKVEELADQLSACADSIHTRVMRDINHYQGGAVPASVQKAARAMLDAEAELRQRADRLYTDAATCIVAPLGQSQQHLMKLTADAAVKITHIVRIGDGITLVARLLGLAAAAASADPLLVLAAIGALELQLGAIAIDNAPPAAPTPPAAR